MGLQQTMHATMQRQQSQGETGAIAAAALTDAVKKQLREQQELTMLRQDGPVEEWELLENFWRKYNKILLDNSAINQEKFHLQNENAKLGALLKQYLDGISVNEDVMNTRNNLLMTNTFSGTAG